MSPRFYRFELVDRGIRSGVRRGITYGGELQRVNLDTKSGNVLLLEFTSQVALDEGGLSNWVR